MPVLTLTDDVIPNGRKNIFVRTLRTEIQNDPTEKQERCERATSDMSTTTRKSTERGTYNKINDVDIKN